MTSDESHRFDKEDAAHYKHWPLPDISSASVVPSAEKELRLQQTQLNAERALHAPMDSDAGESIESTSEPVEPLTADQLQAITEAAEKEGHDKGYQAGFEQGLEAGRAKGHEDGVSSGQQQIREQAERLQRLIQALMIPVEHEQETLQNLMVDMICQISEAIVKRELLLDSSHITGLVEEALAAIPSGSERFILYLNNSDIELVQQYVNQNTTGWDKQFSLHVDEQLLPGGCRLETPHSVVNNSVEQRLKTVLDGFLHKQFVGTQDTIELSQQYSMAERGSE